MSFWKGNSIQLFWQFPEQTTRFREPKGLPWKRRLKGSMQSTQASSEHRVKNSPLPARGAPTWRHLRTAALGPTCGLEKHVAILGLGGKELQCHAQCQDYPRVLGLEWQKILGKKDSLPSPTMASGSIGQDTISGHDAHVPGSGLTSFWPLASLGTCPPVAINVLKTFWRPRFTLERRCLLPLTGPIFPRFSGTENESYTVN